MAEMLASQYPAAVAARRFWSHCYAGGLGEDGPAWSLHASMRQPPQTMSTESSAATTGDSINYRTRAPGTHRSAMVPSHTDPVLIAPGTSLIFIPHP